MVIRYVFNVNTFNFAELTIFPMSFGQSKIQDFWTFTLDHVFAISQLSLYFAARKLAKG